jgi:hypothetical protein
MVKMGLAVAAVAFASSTFATTPSYNTGSLGSAANGTNADSVTLGPGAVGAGGDQAAIYTGAAGSNTVVPHQAALNPGVSSPFTIEFWANPTASDNDDAPVSNRISTSPRSGWVFFQRDAATGWNFRMYDGVNGNLGWDLTGGTATLNSWSHVVATWNGSAAQLYVNGALADSSNGSGASGNYNPSSAANLIVASSDSGSPYTGSIDEVAFYPTALSETQIASHFNSISGADYQAQVRSDGALLQLSNNDVPEPAGVALLGILAGGWALRRRK